MRHALQGRRVLQGILAAVAITTLFGSGEVSAQRFQYLYGSNTCIETGLHGVLQRAIGGYVAVGESFQQPGGCGTSDAYVVATNAAGAQIWSMTYQIGVNSRATDVLELPNGELIVCGYTQLGPPCHAAVSNDIFVLRLTAGGGIINWNTYGGNTTQEEAWQIIRATVGNGGTTAAGDYVIAGSSTNQNVGANRGGYLLRITAGLNLIWDRQYGTANNDDYFTGLDEVPVGQAGAGDIVAVGGSTSPPAIATDVFTVRVNGNSGAIGAAPQNQSWTNFPGGGASVDVGRTIIVLRNGPNAGDLVISGFTTGAPAPSANEEVFVLELGPDPCIQVANVYFGDNGALPDRGAHLVEDANPAIATGNVMVTGFTNINGGFGAEDVFLQRVSTGPGMALLGAAGDYGGNGNDRGGAVANATRNVFGSESPGYIVVGFSASPNLLVAGDPRQLYLIKTGVGLQSFCNDVLLDFPSGHAQNGTVCGAALGPNIGLQCQPNIGFRTWVWGNLLCSVYPKPVVNGGADDGATMSFNGGSLTSYPNPLRSGDALNLRFELNAETTVHVAVSDILGRETYRSDVTGVKGTQMIPVSTEGWPAGTYLVQVTVGTVATTSHVVVLEK